MPIPTRFSPLEALPTKSARALPNILQVSQPGKLDYRSMIIRLLCGTLDIFDSNTNTIINQRNNYSHLTFYKNKSISFTTIKRAISSTGKPVSSITIEKYLSKTRSHNFVFYKELFFEFCNYFSCQSNKQYILGFLHLYRIIEFLALSLPMVWAARCKGYENSFNKLKKFFNDPQNGERNLLQKFITDIIDSNLRSTIISLDINSREPLWQECYYKTLTESNNPEMVLIDPKFIISSLPHYQINISAESLIDLAIRVRDRYFHFLSGKGQSFSSENLPDPNEFFLIICPPLINWLSVLIYEVIIFEFDSIFV